MTFSLSCAAQEIAVEGEQVFTTDSISKISGKEVKPKRDWTTWRPSPKRAMWLAIVCPGAGQIYNRKFWKLPIFLGGFVGCAYAYSWNGQMFTDYRQAYLDLIDDDPTTESYKHFLHNGQVIDASNKQQFVTLFQKRMERYRRYRDLSLFCFSGVYALSIVDSYVDASLSEFNISNDLSLRVAPAYINTNTSNNPLQGGALGVQCSINF